MIRKAFVLTFMYFFSGLFCILLAFIMIFMDLRYPNTLSTILQIDPLDQYDEFVMRKYTLILYLHEIKSIECPRRASLLGHPIENRK